VKRIARTLGIDPKTVRGWLRSGQLPTWPQRSRGSAVDRHAEHLQRRWDEGCRNAAQLWRELRERGFRGRLRTVQRWVVRWRGADPASCPPGRSRVVWKAPGKRRVAWLVVAEADALDATERRFVEAEHRAGRGADQPSQDDQAEHGGPGRLRPAARPRA
jgi:hypothetical protein